MNSVVQNRYAGLFAGLLSEWEAQTRASPVDPGIAPVEQLVQQAERDLPGLLPRFEKDALRGRWPSAFDRYDDALVRGWLQLAVARLQSAAPDPPAPLVYPAGLAFVKDARLRHILEADIQEIQRAFDAHCWKSVVILCGAALEALLVDALLQDASAPPHAKLLERGLADLIELATQRGLISGAVGKFSHSTREYRNLVHPGRVIRDRLSINAEEARIAIEVLNIVCRDLTARLAGFST